MVTDVNPDFDIGPLSWVQGEIDQSLARTLESLQAFDPVSGDNSPLQRARMHFRQAAGAIQMVGLDALQAYTDEIEQQLERLGSGISQQEAEDIIAPVTYACQKLQSFLAELVRGVQLTPLNLYAEYEAMQRSHGVKVSHPADLFCPDLSIQVDDDGPQHIVPPSQFASFLIKERRLYQRGLLSWLRGNIQGTEAMREAAENIEVATPQQTVRTFWWTVMALLDAVREESVANTFPLKQLLARIDLQIRRLIDGSGNVAERLRRETLYFLAVSEPFNEHIQLIQERYQLKALLPAAEAGSGQAVDATTMRRTTREVQGMVAEAKNLWQRLISGQVDQYPKFHDSLRGLRGKVAASVYPETQPLFTSLLRGCDALSVQGIPEAVAMEYATALLFAEDVFSQQGAPIAGLPENVRAIQARVDAALANRSLPALDAALVALSERAQNRLLLAQVSQDIQAGLRHMEQVLDTFFRDNSKRAGLAGLAKDGREISGALRILGQEKADHLLSACMAQITHYNAPETVPDSGDAELLAESLSALGFYIEALEQQHSQREELILPLLERQQERQRRLGEALAAPAAVNVDAAPQAAAKAEDTFVEKAKEKTAVEPLRVVGSAGLPEETSMEAAVEKDVARLHVLGQQLQKNPQSHVLRREIERITLTLGDDAKLVGDAVLVDKVKAIREQIGANAFTEVPALLAALPGAAVAMTPSTETQRLLQVDAGELDAELLDIYLQEAIEVLDNVRVQRAQLGEHPHDHESLRTIRRAFHTLKGSGRMVGLTELGELAYDTEKIHNRLLEVGYPATPTVLTMIDVAEQQFRQWVRTLIANKTVNPNPVALYTAIDAVAHELDPLTPSLIPLKTEAAQKKTSAPAQSESVIEAVVLTKPEPTTTRVETPLGSAAVAAAAVALATEVAEKRDEPVAAEAAMVAEAAVTTEVAEVAEKSEKEAADFIPPDDQGVISLEVDMASLRKAPVDEPDETVNPVQATELPDGSVSLKIDWARFRERKAGGKAKPAAMAPMPIAAAASVPLVDVAAFLPAAKPEIEIAASTPAISLKEAAPTDKMPVETVAPAPIQKEDREDVRVGEVVLPKVLFNLFTEESEQRWLALNHEQALMRLDASYAPPPAMVRAAHTLAGTNLAVGFPQVARVAKALESLLIVDGECRQQGIPVTSRTVPVIARAIAGLRSLIDRIQQRQAFAPAELREAEDIEAEIEALEKQMAATVAKAEAEAVGKSQGAIETTTATTAATASALPSAVSSVLIMGSGAGLPAKPAEGSDAAELTSLHDEIDAQLLPLFLEEGSELHRQTGELLRRLRQSPKDSEIQLRLKRNLHTFKGSARMVGAMRLGELAHRMETYLDEDADTDESYFEKVEADLDRIGYVFDHLRAGESNIAIPGLTEQKEDADKDSGAYGSLTGEAGTAGTAQARAIAVATAASWQPKPAPLPKPVAEEGHLRVSAAKIDRLVNEAGEIIIARTRAEGELRGLKNDLLELTNSVIRLRNHVRVIEIEAESQIQAQLEQMQEIHGDFDPLEFDRYTRLQELTRSIAEGVNDVSTVQQTLLAHLDTANAALLSQARLSHEVQQSLFAVRTVPFSIVTERLYRILRTLSKELQKRANLEIEGAHHGLDRAVLEKLVGPLEHLLRNSLDHGIESPAVRRAANKPETGEIVIAVRQVGNEIVIAFSDDGAGLDMKQLRRVAIDKGFMAKDEEFTDAKLFDLMMQPGFSTVKTVTQVSGRGLGTDIIRNEVTSLGGRVEVTSVLGRGTTFTLYLPLTVAIAQTVMIHGTRNRSWAIPVMMVEQVEHMTGDALAKMYEAGEIERRGRRYPFYYFDRLVDCSDTVPEIRRYNSVIFLRTGQGQVAIHIDQMIGNQEVVIKNAGTQLARVTGLSSATILGDGEIVLIVNPIQLSQRLHIPALEIAPAKSAKSTHKRDVAAPHLVLIVDDSLTIRKVTSRLMVREGYAVETAKDGFEALQVVSERRPDVILLDIEMPKMDGFEFAKLMKSDSKTRDIPIIMITSRTAEKHRKRSQELGVDAYLGKPYQEGELLDAIRKALTPTEVLH